MLLTEPELTTWILKVEIYFDDDFSVMSLYLPSGTNIDRLDHKFKFMDDFQNYINELKKSKHQIWLFAGITTFAMRRLTFMILCATVSGFYQEDHGLTDLWSLVDSFVILTVHTISWWSYRALEEITRMIDYNLVSDSLQHKLKRAVILSDAVHSDHCPI
jgi:exodeoxyribonuclease-3